jgi:hypothetical protein
MRNMRQRRTKGPIVDGSHHANACTKIIDSTAVLKRDGHLPKKGKGRYQVLTGLHKTLRLAVIRQHRLGWCRLGLLY